MKPEVLDEVAGALREAARFGGTMQVLPASCQELSPGRISVVIFPGCSEATATAEAVSQATLEAESMRRTQ